MSQLFLIAKIVVVAFFLIMFLRGNKLIWGIGLLTVTSAILLDTFLSTFGRDEILETLGFFFFVIGGMLFAGAAIWLWAVLRPRVAYVEPAPPEDQQDIIVQQEEPTWSDAVNPTVSGDSQPAFDRQMLYDQIHDRFGRQDILDLIFDLGLNENDVILYNEDISQLIARIINLADERGQAGDLALAVERILTPPPPENLPRLEKLSADSPQTILRHYLLAFYSLNELETMSGELDVDWEMIGGNGKQAKVRNFLLYLYRRNRIEELVELMQETAAEPV